MNQTNTLTGRVIANHLTKYIVESNEQKYTLEISGRFKYLAQHKSDYPVVGDYVKFRETNQSEGIIERVLERDNKLSRLSSGTVFNEHIIASNIDIVFICLSLNEDFHIKKLNNFLRIAHSDDFKTIILLTKKDLCEDVNPYISDVEFYSDDDYYIVSIYDEKDIENIKEIIGKTTAVFIGSSGVGKSTLVNALIGEEHFETNTVRLSDAQGRHTTVHKELVHLDSGGSIIDSPGIRIVNSYYVEDIETEFQEVFKIASQCRFKDCKHEDEPECAIREALLTGALDAELYNQYVKTEKFNNFSRRQKTLKMKRIAKIRRYKK